MRSRALRLAALLLWTCGPGVTLSQTPSPLQEWQYSGGRILEELFEPGIPKWQAVVGVSVASQTVYPGSKSYHLLGGPVFDIHYRDIAFASSGEGIGVNLLRGEKFRAGISIGLDLGRHVSDDYPRLHGLSDLGNAPFAEVFGSYVISKQFPLVLRADARHLLGGASGNIGDAEAYLPLPGSSRKLIMFAGPAITFADHTHMQNVFGVNASQAAQSGEPVFMARGGVYAWGLGFSATRFITPHVLITTEAGLSHLLGSAAESPVTQSATQGALALAVEYQW